MKKILHVLSSPRGEASASILLANKIIAEAKAKYPGSIVKENNVLEHDYAHLSLSHVEGFMAPPEKYTPDHTKAVTPSNEAVAEIQEADIIIVSLPLYNFNMPSGLKAWIDHIVRAGITFSYKTGAPEGLLKGKKVYLAIASNGMYTDGPTKTWDYAEPYLRHILGFLGLTDITTLRIEGSAIPGIKETAVQKGLDSVAAAFAA